MNTNSTSYSVGGTGRVKTVTVRTMEYDKDGNLVKETETITEYEQVAVPYSPYPNPINPYTISWQANTSPEDLTG